MARRRSAEALATEQRAISVSEFFAANRHLLGFDSSERVLLAAVKEAVDNALDACEEAGYLPEVTVAIEKLGKDRHRVAVTDNGPGIVEAQVGRIFGKLLYGSKFHHPRQSRGQQGLGIAAAGMVAQLTTGAPVRIVTRTSPKKPAHELRVTIDTTHNRPVIRGPRETRFEAPHGTRVELVLEGQYHHGPHSIALFLKLTSLANPHATLRLVEPDGNTIVFERGVRRRPPLAPRVAPHPHGIELGRLAAMLKETHHRTLSGFLVDELAGIGRARAEAIVQASGGGLELHGNPHRLSAKKVALLHRALAEARVPAPRRDVVVPIGEAAILRGLAAELPARFHVAVTRPPAVYRGHVFVVEVGLAYGHVDEAHVEVTEDGHLRRKGGKASEPTARAPARVLRFANRVPLLHQASHCAITQAVIATPFRRYGLDQPEGGLPLGPLRLVVHVASSWVPFTSEAKEAIAADPEILRELGLALRSAGRALAAHLRREASLEDELEKRLAIERYLPHVGLALASLLELGDARRAALVGHLAATVERKRRAT
ncbi:MAG: DNA topoisomerase VI subunit B [Polyangiales bacterium]